MNLRGVCANVGDVDLVSEARTVITASASTLLVNLVGGFLADVMRQGLSPATQHARRAGLFNLLRHLERRGVWDVHHVREAHLEAWSLFLREHVGVRRGARHPARYSSGTIVSYLVSARRFFRWLVDEEMLLMNPARILSMRGLGLDPVATLQIPTRQQMRQLMKRMPRNELIQVCDWVAVELMYSSGLRIGEVCKMDVSDVDLGDGVVRVRQGKWRKDRVVPLGQPACKALRRWLAVERPQLVKSRAEQALFVTASGSRLKRVMFGRRLKKVGQLVGLTRMRPHDLRHAAALHLLQGGADLRHIQEFLGHATLQTAQVYTRLTPNEVKAAHRKAHPRERLQERK